MKIQAPGAPSLAHAAKVERGGGRSDFDAAVARAGGSMASEPGEAVRDFARMTRDELFHWMNDRIKGGELSLDDSAGLLGLAGRGALGAPAANAAPASDQDRLNFFQIAQDRVAAARERREGSVEAIYQTALAVMRQFQKPI